jgi:sensory rhodopsin
MTLLTLTTWFALGTAGMALGTILLAWGYTQLPDQPRRAYLELIAVTLIATVAYGLMALDIGAVETARGATLYVPRYVDWLLTTPLHVLYIGWLAGAERTTLGKLVTLQAATIVLGFVGAMVGIPLNFVFFAVGAAVFGVLVYLFYGEVAQMARQQDDRRLSLYRKLRNFVVVLWLVYPIIWLLSGPGFGLMGLETSSLVITYIDVVAKVGFGLIAFNDLQTVFGTASEQERAERTPSAAD